MSLVDNYTSCGTTINEYNYKIRFKNAFNFKLDMLHLYTHTYAYYGGRATFIYYSNEYSKYVIL